MKYTEFKYLFETGIYKITCLSNSKIYIGSAVATKGSLSMRGFYRRWKEHIRKLEQNKHRNHYLQNCWDTYGKQNFNFEIIELCTRENVTEREEYWINYYKSYHNTIGFNIIKTGLANYGIFTEEHKQRISQALKGKKRNLEDVKKWSNPVLQIDKKTYIILNTYYSMSEASRLTGIQRQDIGQVCKGNLKSAGGYFWKKLKT